MSLPNFGIVNKSNSGTRMQPFVKYSLVCLVCRNEPSVAVAASSAKFDSSGWRGASDRHFYSTHRAAAFTTIVLSSHDSPLLGARPDQARPGHKHT